MRTALIAGGDSRIGAAVARRLAEQGWKVLATTRHKERVTPDRPWLDLESCTEAMPSLPSCAICLIAAAAVKIDECRRDPAATRRVNVAGTAAVAGWVAQQQGFTLLLSTNQVFDGSRPLCKIEDAVCPLTDYGRQKADAEAAILAGDGHAAVLRLTKLLAPDAPLLQGWLAAWRRNQPVTAFRDMTIAPVTLPQTVEAITLLLTGRAAGLHHFSGDRDVSYLAIARELAARAEIDPALVQDSSFRDAGIPPEFAPRHTTLDCRDLRAWQVTPLTSAQCLDQVLGQALAVAVPP